MSFKNKYQKYQYKYIFLINYQTGGELNDLIYNKLQKLINFLKKKYNRLSFQDREKLKIGIKLASLNKKFTLKELNNKIQKNSNIDDKIKEATTELMYHILSKEQESDKQELDGGSQHGLTALLYVALMLCKIAKKLKLAKDENSCNLFLETINIF